MYTTDLMGARKRSAARKAKAKKVGRAVLSRLIPGGRIVRAVKRMRTLKKRAAGLPKAARKKLRRAAIASMLIPGAAPIAAVAMRRQLRRVSPPAVSTPIAPSTAIEDLADTPPDTSLLPPEEPVEVSPPEEAAALTDDAGDDGDEGGGDEGEGE